MLSLFMVSPQKTHKQNQTFMGFGGRSHAREIHMTISKSASYDPKTSRWNRKINWYGDLQRKEIQHGVNIKSGYPIDWTKTKKMEGTTLCSPCASHSRSSLLQFLTLFSFFLSLSVIRSCEGKDHKNTHKCKIWETAKNHHLEIKVEFLKFSSL